MVWQNFLGLLGGGGAGGGGTVDTAKSVASFGASEKAEESRQKFEESSRKRDALVRQALEEGQASVPFSFDTLGINEGAQNRPNPASGAAPQESSSGVLGFIKDLMEPPDESDTAIPEEDPSVEATQSGQRKIARAQQRESQPQATAKYIEQLDSLFGGPE